MRASIRINSYRRQYCLEASPATCIEIVLSQGNNQSYRRINIVWFFWLEQQGMYSTVRVVGFLESPKHFMDLRCVKLMRAMQSYLHKWPDFKNNGAKSSAW
jgi:hypothetical protein